MASVAHEFLYDVFLSFRGEDTRYGFTGNLKKALDDKGVRTFMDDEELQKGDEITPSLLKAIEDSKITIVVLSKNYASSSFCLQELSKILESMKDKGRSVLPVFYKVDPSDVRKLKRSYGEAMDKHEASSSSHNIDNRWKTSLHQVANLSGFRYKKGEMYEHEFIGKIVEEVLKKITVGITLHAGDYVVGLEPKIQRMAMTYHSIKDINKKKEVWRLAVIVDDLWSTFKGDKEDMLEMVLRDISGDTIHATILANDVKSWKHLLTAGKTFFMRNFRVGDNDHHFKISVHACKLTFVGGTKVDPLDIPQMPTTLFKLKDFEEIRAGKFRPDVLVDVVGYVHTLGKCVTSTNTKKGNIAFTIMDSRDNLLDCTLWDSLSLEFLDLCKNRTDSGPVVVIIKNARVKEPQGLYPLQLSNVWNGTKLLFDENIAEIKAFKASLPKDGDYTIVSGGSSNSTQVYTQGSYVSQQNSDELFMKKARVMRIGDMKFLKQDTICVTVVDTTKIKVSNQGWFFRSCRECNRKCEGSKPPYICNQGHQNNDPIIKYKLDVEVCDGNETAKFVFWDNTLDELMGMTAAVLLNKIKESGISDPREYPDDFDDIMDRTFAFRVKWQFSWGHGSVLMCNDSKDLVATIEEQLPNAETKGNETATLPPTDKNNLTIADTQPSQAFTKEDLANFKGLSDSILSTPNVSLSAENSRDVSSEKTPAKMNATKISNPILSTPNVSLSAETDPALSSEKTPAKRIVTNKTNSILSTPNTSASGSAETDPTVASEITPAKRNANHKAGPTVLDGQLSSSRGRKLIKKEK